jgi:hypothetical protein
MHAAGRKESIRGGLHPRFSETTCKYHTTLRLFLVNSIVKMYARLRVRIPRQVGKRHRFASGASAQEDRKGA